jgi:hypothetical protein
VGGEEAHVLTQPEGKCEFDVTAQFTQPGSINPDGTAYVGGMTLQNANGTFAATSPQGTGSATGTVGSATADAHNVMQPCAVVRKLIKATT